MAAFNFSIDLPIRNDWANVDLIRSSVQNCFTAMFSDLDGCHALAMITGELLENAIKYGRWNERDRDPVFRLRVWGDGESARVSVENPIRTDDKEVGRLFETLEWIRGYQSTDEAYRARLLQIAESPRDGSTSRLGLVRIAYEGNCRLDADLNRDTLKVTATVGF